MNFKEYIQDIIDNSGKISISKLKTSVLRGLVKFIFSDILKQLEGKNEGKLTIPRLGNFIISKKTDESKGKRILFKPFVEKAK